MRSFRVSSLFSFRRIGLMKVPGDRATPTVFLELSLDHRLAVVHESDREQRPVSRVRGVTDVGVLGEALAHAAVAVVDGEGPDATALAGESQFVGDAHSRGALVAQQEGQRLDDRGGDRLLERPGLAHEVAHPPERDLAHDRLERAAERRQAVERASASGHGLHQAVLHHLAKTGGQNARRNARPAAQLLEAARLREQVPDEHERPAVADQVEAAVNRVEDRAGRGEAVGGDAQRGLAPSSYPSGAWGGGWRHIWNTTIKELHAVFKRYFVSRTVRTGRPRASDKIAANQAEKRHANRSDGGSDGRPGRNPRRTRRNRQELRTSPLPASVD